MVGSSRKGAVVSRLMYLPVWVYGKIDGDLHCISLVIDRDAHISGTVTARARRCGWESRRSEFREERSF